MRKNLGTAGTWHIRPQRQRRRPLEVYRISENAPELSTLFFSHDDNPHWKPFATINADKTIYKGKKVVFLIRDPRDVLVSCFFQYTLRGDHKIANDPDQPHLSGPL